MCSECQLPANSGDLTKTLRRRGAALLLLVLAGVLLLALAPGQKSKADRRSFNASDRVFVRDLSARSAEGRALAGVVQRFSARRDLRGAAAALARIEREELATVSSARRSLGIAPGNQRAPLTLAAVPDDLAVRRLVAHSQDDILLAKIELSAGSNPELRDLARYVLRAHTAALMRLAPVGASTNPGASGGGQGHPKA